jgi:hypothetical protein
MSFRISQNGSQTLLGHMYIIIFIDGLECFLVFDVTIKVVCLKVDLLRWQPPELFYKIMIKQEMQTVVPNNSLLTKCAFHLYRHHHKIKLKTTATRNLVTLK